MPDNADYIKLLEKEFDHPAVILWRAIELKNIEKELANYKLGEFILDLGCAEGNIAKTLFKNRNLVGLDNCWEFLKENDSYNVYKSLTLGDACLMPYKNQIFSSVFSNCVIEHIPDLDSLLKEVERVLNDKGFFVFTVPSDKFPGYLFFSKVFRKIGLIGIAKWYERKRNSMLNHFHCYGHNYWKDILQENGLKLIGYRYYMGKKATFWWDFIAFIYFIFRKFKINFGNHQFIMRQIQKIYFFDCQKNEGEGAALLIVAQKRG